MGNIRLDTNLAARKWKVWFLFDLLSEIVDDFAFWAKTNA